MSKRKKNDKCDTITKIAVALTAILNLVDKLIDTINKLTR